MKENPTASINKIVAIESIEPVKEKQVGIIDRLKKLFSSKYQDEKFITINDNKTDKGLGNKKSYNVAFIGHKSVGKRTLVKNIINKFNPSSSVMTYLNINNNDIFIHFHDIDNNTNINTLFGSENYDIIFVVFDVSDKKSFSEIGNWMEIMKKIGNKKILIGNKNDLVREINDDDAIKFASDKFDRYIETNSSNDKNINLFDMLGKQNEVHVHTIY